MKKNLTISGIALGLALLIGGVLYFASETPKAQAAFNGYTYQRALTVANASSTQTNFPVEVCFNTTPGNGNACPTATDLKATSSAGSIQTATGLDIIFSTSTDASSILPFEREFYSSTTGSSIFWVNMPTVTNGQIIYMYYGKAADTDHASATAVWDSNFKAVWHLPNGTTLTGGDSTSNGLTGTLTNTPTASTGQVDGSANFVSGSSQYITRSNISNASNNFSITLWANTSANNGTTQALFNNGGTNANGYVLRKTGAGVINFDFSFVANLSSGATLATGTWTSIAVVRNSGTTQIYVNGVAAGGTSSSNPNSPGTRTTIGASETTGSVASAFFSGDLDEVRFSTSARSTSWIATEYNTESNPNTFWTIGGATISQANAQVVIRGDVQTKMQGDVQVKIIGQ